MKTVKRRGGKTQREGIYFYSVKRAASCGLSFRGAGGKGEVERRG